MTKFTNDHLSYSRLSRFENCPLSFKLRYIDKLQPKKPARVFFGTLVHRALEGLVREAVEQKHIGPLSEDRSFELLRQCWKDEDIPENDSLDRAGFMLIQFVHLPTGPEYTRIVGGTAGRSSPTFSTASAPLTTVQLAPGWSPCRLAVVAVSVAVGSHRRLM